MKPRKKRKKHTPREPFSYDVEMTPNELYNHIINKVWEKLNRPPNTPVERQFLRGYLKGDLRRLD